jgi:hypothetical protein
MTRRDGDVPIRQAPFEAQGEQGKKSPLRKLGKSKSPHATTAYGAPAGAIPQRLKPGRREIHHVGALRGSGQAEAPTPKTKRCRASRQIAGIPTNRGKARRYISGCVREVTLVQVRDPALHVSNVAAASEEAISVRERHLGFHAGVVVVLSIDFAENLEGQVAGAMGRCHAPNAKLVLDLVREL